MIPSFNRASTCLRGKKINVSILYTCAKYIFSIKFDWTKLLLPLYYNNTCSWGQICFLCLLLLMSSECVLSAVRIACTVRMWERTGWYSLPRESVGYYSSFLERLWRLRKTHVLIINMMFYPIRTKTKKISIHFFTCLVYRNWFFTKLAQN